MVTKYGRNIKIRMIKKILVFVYIFFSISIFSISVKRLEDVDYSEYNFYKNAYNLIKNSFNKPWLPINEIVGRLVTGVELTYRKEKFITQSQVEEINSELEPADILLRRLNWQMTNILITGFWKHSGIYLSNLEDLDLYFKDLEILNDEKFGDYLKRENYDAYLQLKSEEKVIIEGIHEGIVIKPIENMALSDGFAALRPVLSKEEKFLILMKSFSYLGKGYDYGFDIRTEEYLTCSELIFHAFNSVVEGFFKNSYLLNIPTFSPMDILEKFYEESKNKNVEPSLKFILFYDTSEKNAEAFKSTEEEFLETLYRNQLYYFFN